MKLREEESQPNFFPPEIWSMRSFGTSIIEKIGFSICIRSAIILLTNVIVRNSPKRSKNGRQRRFARSSRCMMVIDDALMILRCVWSKKMIDLCNCGMEISKWVYFFMGQRWRCAVVLSKRKTGVVNVVDFLFVFS